MECSYFLISILVSVWTIIQTAIHLGWALFGYSLYVCQFRPRHYDIVFLYLTYFYRRECGDIMLNPKDFFLLNNLVPVQNNGNISDLYVILNIILEKAILPEESTAAERANIYIKIFIIIDGFWACSALVLLVGACCKMKKRWLVIIYGSWLVITACTILLDVVSAVHFGLDIRLIYSYTSWLKFIGVKNYMDFSDLNQYEDSHVIPTIPSTILCGLFSRLFLIWLVNIVCFFLILNHAAILLQGDNIRSQIKAGHPDKITLDNGEELDLNSSEARIRNWQLFYGAIEVSSTLTNSSPNERDSGSNNRNFSSDMRVMETENNTRQRQSYSGSSSDSHERYKSVLKNAPKRAKTIHDLNVYYRRYSDVASGLEERCSHPNYNLRSDSLKGQLPWTYFNPNELRENYQSTYVIRHEGKSRPKATIGKDGFVSTEL